jgi:hypothetical protein
VKTKIEVDTDDAFVVRTACDILTGYLEKKGVGYQFISYTKSDDGHQMSIVKVG